MGRKHKLKSALIETSHTKKGQQLQDEVDYIRSSFNKKIYIMQQYECYVASKEELKWSHKTAKNSKMPEDSLRSSKMVKIA